MTINLNKIINIMIIAILTLIVIIYILFFIKISSASHPYLKGVDIEKNYPYSRWQNLLK
ncbi:MAG TPA: hypothetical protein PKX79_07750 [Spirochaetota bacterium]|jgi:hypothetical protein|nr:hypothetical protein [Spirochaetota bacterium]OQA96285.1 MAG: hypothetical protein BWY23_02119 [Spirochaetes bacterium ADurb.Bin218]HOK02431.1 hypothetical protein [Spirochaetota bacterium]HOK92831.1 hypothetical protein [Spirochaetota bacterium]HOQ12390.1 hypothetical protein [Spirochaetota bacterium]